MAVEINPESQQDVPDALADVEDRPLNPKPLKRATFPEGYFTHDLNMHVHMGVRPERDGLESRHFCAVLEYVSFGPDVDGLDSGVSGSFLETELRADECTGSEVKFSMFIPVRKLSEPIEGMRSGVIRSHVRLQPLEECNVEGVHPFGLAFPAVQRILPYPVASPGV